MCIEGRFPLSWDNYVTYHIIYFYYYTCFSKAVCTASSNISLWYNPTLHELLRIPDPQRCISRGIKYLCHLYTEQGLKSFAQLKDKFNLPSSFLFIHFLLVTRITIWLSLAPVICGQIAENTKEVRHHKINVRILLYPNGGF